MTIKELRLETGLSQAKFAEYFNIPKGTLQNWEQGHRTPPRYVTELIEYKIEKENLGMNKAIKEAMEIMEGVYVQDLPQVKIGEEVALKEIWDGEGEVPEESCSYQIAEIEWINYEFEIVEENEDGLETIVRITNIELL